MELFGTKKDIPIPALYFGAKAISVIPFSLCLPAEKMD
jgi:hypothetical protein